MSPGGDAGPRYCPSCEREFDAQTLLCPYDRTNLVRLLVRDAPELGATLEGRYTVGERIGRGAMGDVYRGIQISVGRPVAIKVISPSLTGDPIIIKRFLREAKLACMLAHPNAVTVLDFGQTAEGLFYLVMELLVGRTLDQVLEAEGTLPPERIARIGVQICAALGGAHQLQIVHRDLKPANIMLLANSEDEVKVLDFGLAKSLATRAGAANMTSAGALLGTPAYMAPELVTGGVSDARADLYALGCVLYCAAAGAPPFAATSVPELIMLHATEVPPPLRGLPRDLARLIERLLAKDPMERPQTAAETSAELQASVHTARDAEHDTVLQPSTSTILGWTTAPAPQRAVSARELARPSPSTRIPTQPDDRDIHTSAPAMFVPGGITPRVRAQRRTRRWLLPLALVTALAGVLAAFALLR